MRFTSYYKDKTFLAAFSAICCFVTLPNLSQSYCKRIEEDKETREKEGNETGRKRRARKYEEKKVK
jgi:hypothetical protein